MNTRTAILVILLVATFLTPLITSIIFTVDIPKILKALSIYYIRNTIKDVASPEAVAAIVWDYRGLDTIYETLVLYLAIVGGLALFRVSRELVSLRRIGLTFLARTSTKIIALLIATIAVSIALHGHLTPGGGFQGGSALAVVTMLMIPVFSSYIITEKGITSTKLVAIRGFALTAIGLVAFLPLIRGLEIVTNIKFYPAQLGIFIVSGSISLYNLFEFLAVASGFTAIALYLSIPEELYSKELGGVYA